MSLEKKTYIQKKNILDTIRIMDNFWVRPIEKNGEEIEASLFLIDGEDGKICSQDRDA